MTDEFDDASVPAILDTSSKSLNRRSALAALAGLGVGTAVFQRALAAQAQQEGKVTPEMVQQAEWIAGITLSEDDRKAAAGNLQRDRQRFESLHKYAVNNALQPAITFFATPPQDQAAGVKRGDVQPLDVAVPQRPASDEDLAFLPVTKLAALIRARSLTSVELTRLYLGRLKRFDEVLKCVVSLTEELALSQAEQADREIAAGRYRGPLHGIPWGAKDLISYPGYKTTWGAEHFKKQALDAKASVAHRLEEAGAVMVAKLTLGALALGDEWYGGMTRNPWNPDEGSSGSSAGSTAAVVAGLVGFAIGSETLGSIVSPSRRCSATGLRPTFGRVSRAGCMTLAWTMDKLGPLCRSVEDCALVLGAIHGYDGLDLAAVDQPFSWPPRREVQSLRVGYFETNKPIDERPEIAVLKELGVKLVPIKLPSGFPMGAMMVILNTETAAAFDDITLAGVREGLGRWGMPFRVGRFVPAVDYLRANRIRTELMRAMGDAMNEVDAYVEGDDLLITNLTGHPTIILPFGERNPEKNKQPGTIAFTGRLFGETDLLLLAHAFQQATDAHLRRPPLEELLAARSKQPEGK
jgi:Asp-tRNA(Asn)/Glu-tRNA(Gln) amidotransferase A subunit family amidase